jgi:hypothetical protein
LSFGATALHWSTVHKPFLSFLGCTFLGVLAVQQWLRGPVKWPRHVFGIVSLVLRMRHRTGGGGKVWRAGAAVIVREQKKKLRGRARGWSGEK